MVTGKVAPVTVNPDPVTVAALTVKAAEPEEVNMSDWVAGEPKTTFPNGRLFELMLSVGVAEGFNCSAKVFETPPEVAVNVDGCTELTELMVAKKAALVALAGTMTAEGRVTAALLLVRPMLIPPLGAGPLNVTLHVSLPAPVIDPLLQESAVSAAVAAPVPLMFTTMFPSEESLERVNTPVNELA